MCNQLTSSRFKDYTSDRMAKQYLKTCAVSVKNACIDNEGVRRNSYNHLVANTWAPQIQVWLLLEELVEVALSPHFIVSPRWVSKHTYLRETRTETEKLRSVNLMKLPFSGKVLLIINPNRTPEREESWEYSPNYLALVQFHCSQSRRSNLCREDL